MEDTPRKLPADGYKEFLKSGDTWDFRGKPILTHEAVERIAREYGVTVHNYEWYKTSLSDQLVMVEVTGYWEDGRITPEVGEASSKNLDSGIGGNYPHSTCWKRGYDRAVLKHLGIEAYSAEESSDFRDKSSASSPRVQTTSQTKQQATHPKQQATHPNQQTAHKEQGPTVTQGSGHGGGSGRMIEASHKKAVATTIRLLQNKGNDITEESLLKEVYPDKSSLDELTYEEAVALIKRINEMLSGA